MNYELTAKGRAAVDASRKNGKQSPPFMRGKYLETFLASVKKCVVPKKSP